MNENDQFMCGVVEGVFNFICDRQQGRISTLTIFDKSFDVKKLTSLDMTVDMAMG